jgi:hypothetical protein
MKIRVKRSSEKVLHRCRVLILLERRRYMLEFVMEWGGVWLGGVCAVIEGKHVTPCLDFCFEISRPQQLRQCLVCCK